MTEDELTKIEAWAKERVLYGMRVDPPISENENRHRDAILTLIRGYRELKFRMDGLEKCGHFFTPDDGHTDDQ